MKPGVIYKGEWMMADDATTVQVRIKDMDNLIPDGDTEVIYNLTTSGNPLRISVINNGRKKYGIFSKQAVFEFISTQTINAYTFVESTDQRWYVEIKVNDADILFLGYLVLSETTRPFLPNGQVISLTASDNLGLLKERKLVTPDDLNPQGKNRIAYYVAWVLKKTGLNLPINVVNNIKPGKGSLATTLFFSSSGDYIVTSGLITNFFNNIYSFSVTGTASNNTTFTIDHVDNSGLATVVYVNENITVGESSSTAVATDNATGHIYDKIFIDARTYEEKIGESKDGYTLLEDYVLDKDCALFQYKGEWWIIRYDEINTDPYYIASFDEDGEYVSIGSGVAMEKEIGATGDAKWAEAGQVTSYDRPFKYAKHTFNYEYPSELPCNIDFDRGSNETVISSTEKNYDLDCWTLREGHPGAYGTVDGTTAKLVKKYNDNNYEIERYVKLTPRTTYDGGSWDDATYIESEGIAIEEKDKFNTSIDIRLTNNTSGISSVRIFRVLLFGDDGSYWVLGKPSDTSGSDNTPTWYDTSNFTTNSGRGKTDIDFADDGWQTSSWEAPPAPVTGIIYLWVEQLNQNSAGWDDYDVHFSNLQFEYIPYINGSYQKYTGQSSKAERTDTGYSANEDETVNISDSPKPEIKGGMFAKHGTVYVLQPVYWSAQQWALSEPNNNDYFQPFEYHRVNAMYNQNHKTIRYFEGPLFGGLTTDWPDMIHNYQVTDADFDSANRRFMMIEMEQDWKSGRWRAKFAETYHTDGRVFPPFEFKYITNG